MTVDRKPARATRADLIAAIDHLSEFIPSLGDDDTVGDITASAAARVIGFLEQEVTRRDRRAQNRTGARG